jgi:hypothetical protein
MSQSSRLVAALVLVVAIAPVSVPAAAQWLKLATPGAPRTTDGKVDLSAPTPRMANGKPDLSGLWTANQSCPTPGRECGRSGPGPFASRELNDIGVSLPGGLPYQPWLAALVKERTANHAKDDPHVRCFPDFFLRAYGLPHFLKFVHTPALLVVLNEMNANYRQVFTDGRALPGDPNPSWQGYSSAKWDGDTLVVDTIGFRDDLWIDWNGSVVTSTAKVRERIRRPDFGHLEIEVAVDDPKAYTRPWTVTLREQFGADAELHRRNLSGKRKRRSASEVISANVAQRLARRGCILGVRQGILGAASWPPSAYNPVQQRLFVHAEHICRAQENWPEFRDIKNARVSVRL